ncbi:uncharacterized protein LOC113282888 [Papaver somniferum]|uniref:uncharacterized protein LOC113282888 n=1 Tax=Papaver somniferum TaxID=3469 RepID=UPI000E6FF8D9|nr:uncharacterized protein LOC113282888 [Papaver somniferum]
MTVIANLAITTTNSGGRSLSSQDRLGLVNTLTDTQWETIVEMLKISNNDSKEKLSGKWILDTGASRHMTGSKEFLFKTHKIGFSSVKLPNGTYSHAPCEGTVVFENNMKLYLFLFLPDLRGNLISLACLIKDLKCIVTLTDKLCVIQDRTTRTVIGVGEERDGVYIFHSGTLITANRVSAEEDYCLWHRRLGHASNKVISLLPCTNKVDCQKFLDEPCDICFKAKQTRTSFPFSETKADDFFHLVHCDVWGLYRTPSSCGAHYFLTIVDDYSRCVWVYLIAHKTEVVQIFQNFCAMARTQFDRQVKKVRSDNGTEFLPLIPFITKQDNNNDEECQIELERRLEIFGEHPDSWLCDSTSNPGGSSCTGGHNSPGNNSAATPSSNDQTVSGNDRTTVPGSKEMEQNLSIVRYLSPSERDLSAVQNLSPIDSTTTQAGEVMNLFCSAISGIVTANDKIPKVSDKTIRGSLVNSRDGFISSGPQQSMSDVTERQDVAVRYASDATLSAETASDVIRDNSDKAVRRSFLAAITTLKEPTSYAEAVKLPCWRVAMAEEIGTLDKNGTLSITDLPPRKKAIGCKWVYKIKYNFDGSVERYKDRLVVLGNRQVEGVDYHETFAPVAKMVSVRTFLAVTVAQDWELHQMDVHIAFLHGDLDEEVYMQLPPGYSTTSSGKVCRLHRSLYGLRQAPRNWFSKLASALKAFGFIQSYADYSLFTLRQGENSINVLVFVDDLIIVGNNSAAIATFKTYLSRCFHMKDLGPLKYFLGIEISRDDGPLYSDSSQYRRLIGRLIYLTITRPELCYSVHVLAQFMQSPRVAHWEAALRVLRYLKSHPGQGIVLRKDSALQLIAYCDSDWASCPLSRRSLTGYFIFLGGSPISWKTKKQHTMSRSSAEAEYRSVAHTCSELTWLKALLKSLGVSHSQPMRLYCDSQSALHIAVNPVFHERTKHIEIDCHYVRDHIQSGAIITSHIRTTAQLADIFTKALGRP